ncbi:hypothetical protein BDAP_001174 [Binucleata daphniae]
MYSLNEIIEKGRINTKCTKIDANEYKLPEIMIMNRQNHNKIEYLLNTNLNIEVFNDILEYFKKAKYKIDSNINENVKFLLRIQKLTKKYEININLEHLVSDYKELIKILEEEKKIDLMEIRLVKIKQKQVKNISCNNKMEMMVQKIKERRIDDQEMLKYFAFVSELPIVNKIIQENEMIQKIKCCNESIEKRIFMHLYEHKGEHIGVLADKLDVERLDLLQIIIKMENETDCITFNRTTDIVCIKYYT